MAPRVRSRKMASCSPACGARPLDQQLQPVPDMSNTGRQFSIKASRTASRIAIMTSALAMASATVRAEPAPPASPSSSAQPLRLDSDDGRASLLRLDPDIWIVNARHRSQGPRPLEHWTRVCDAPCNALVDRNGLFMIAGDGLTPSEPFSLGKDVKTLKVTAGSSARRSLGLAGVVLGAGIASIGIGMAATTQNPTSPPPGWPASLGWDQPSNPPAALTWGFVVIGAVMLIVGTAVAAGQSTVVEPSPSP